MINKSKAILAIFLLILLNACATQQRKDYTKFRAESPKSILVVPVVNKSVDVDAPDYFLSTISRPLAERGYYVFPVHLVKRLMEDGGLSDADMVRKNDPRILAKRFGADTVMYITIEQWNAKYALFSTTVTVELKYDLKSGVTGQRLWTTTQKITYTPQANNTGNPLADLVAAAIIATIEKAKPNYIPLAQRANLEAITTKGQGLPAGPYDAAYLHDQNDF